jgi:myo-inositol-1-phosphate synthase
MQKIFIIDMRKDEGQFKLEDNIFQSINFNQEKIDKNKEYITNYFNYKWNHVSKDSQTNKLQIKNMEKIYEFRTDCQVAKTGLLLVGLGGNNGTTVVGGILANKHKISWTTKTGIQNPNFYGSLTQSSTTKIGVMDGREIYLPLNGILPMVDPRSLIVHGWDINEMNLAEAMKRAEVFDWDLQCKLKSYMEKIKPLPGIYYRDFIASNQEDRANHILSGNDKSKHLEIIRQNIRDFKSENGLEKVIVLWTANTERMSEEVQGVNLTDTEILKSIEKSHKEIAPSVIYAVASILEGCSFINGSPQNTLLPGVIALAEKHGVYVVGNDFKSGQTKFKTAFTEFLVHAGIKPKSIVSYNHLGNNDGKNLNEEQQFKSKEKSKSSCVDDILYSNVALFKQNDKSENRVNSCYFLNNKNETIDHTVVIKYVPSTGDSKKAMDEYISEIFMGGQHVFTCYNVCEDSLLAAPLIIDLVLLTELFERICVREKGKEKFEKFYTVLDLLGYLLKAPMVEKGRQVINSLTRQRNQIENILKVCAGIPLETNLALETRVRGSDLKLN